MRPDAAHEPVPVGPAARDRKLRRGRWVVPVLIGGLVHLAAFAMLHVPVISNRPTGWQRPSIEWVVPPVTSTDSLLAEQLMFFDHAPLFLPTRWNYEGTSELSAIEHSPADIFQPYADRLRFDPVSLPVGASELPSGGSALDVLKKLRWPYFDAFGRVDKEVMPLEPRLAAVEVRLVESGELMHVETVPIDQVDAAEPWPDWRPFDLFVSITPEGAVATPMSGGGLGRLASGNATPEVVIDFFRRFLRRESRLELYLPAGFYRVTVGP